MKATTPTTATPAAGSPISRRKPSAQFLYDDKGRKSHVLLDIKLYEKLMDELEDREDARDFALAIASGDQGIPLAEFRAERAAIKQQKANAM